MLRDRAQKSPPYAGARTPDNRVDPSPATGDKNEMRQLFMRKPDDEVAMRKGGKVTKVMKAAKSKGKRK